MDSSAPSSGGGGGDKPPQSAPDDSTSLGPWANPPRNGGFPVSPPAPAPSSGDDDRSVMGMMEGPDRRARARCGTKRLLLALMRKCSACEARKKMFLDEREARNRLDDPPANPQSDGEFSALPSSSGDGKPVLGLGMEFPDSRAQALGTKRWCPACELRKKKMFDKREARRRLDPPADPRRNSEFSAPLPAPPSSSGDGKPVVGLGLGMELPSLRVRALCETKWPPSAQTTGCPACEVRKKMMLFRREGLRRDYEKLALEVAGFGAGAGGGGLRGKMLDEREGLRVDKDNAKLAQLQGAQEPSSSAAAGVDILHEKMIHYEWGVLQDSMEFMRLLEPQEAGSIAAAGGGGLGGSHGGLDHEAMYNLVTQTKERMQDIVETVIPQLFSKEILYETVKECVGRYPKWLEENKDKVKKEEYEQYQKQLELMVNLTVVYDNDPENFSKITKIMYKIGECGRPPSDIIADISPGLDPSTMGQLYPGMLELLHNVMGNPFSK